MIRRQYSSVSCVKNVVSDQPTVLAITAMLPKRSTHSRHQRVGLRSIRDVARERGARYRPISLIASAVSWAASPVDVGHRPARAPYDANIKAVARPIPEPAPTTTTALSVNST